MVGASRAGAVARGGGQTRAALAADGNVDADAGGVTDVRLELATDLARGGGVVRSVGGRTHKTGVPARRYAGDERIASTNEKEKTDA